MPSYIKKTIDFTICDGISDAEYVRAKEDFYPFNGALHSEAHNNYTNPTKAQ